MKEGPVKKIVVHSMPKATLLKYGINDNPELLEYIEKLEFDLDRAKTIIQRMLRCVEVLANKIPE